jgi:MFS family permease
MARRATPWLLLVVAAVDMFAVGLLVPQLPSTFAAMGATATGSGAMASIYGAANLLGWPLFGMLTDRLGVRHTLVLAMLGSAAGYALVGLATALPLMALGRAVTGLFKQTLTISKAAIAMTTHGADRAGCMGTLSSAASAGFILGPLLSGYLFDDAHHGLRYLAATTTTFFCLNAALVWVYLPPGCVPHQRCCAVKTGFLTLLSLCEQLAGFFFFVRDLHHSYFTGSACCPPPARLPVRLLG